MDSPCYAGTTNEMVLGDFVSVDGDPGKIVLICMPESENAETYKCTETGGLLIGTEGQGLMLISFEEFGKVEFVERPPQKRLNL